MDKIQIKIRNPVAKQLRSDFRFNQKVTKTKTKYDRNKIKIPKDYDDG